MQLEINNYVHGEKINAIIETTSELAKDNRGRVAYFVKACKVLGLDIDNALIYDEENELVMCNMMGETCIEDRFCPDTRKALLKVNGQRTAYKAIFANSSDSDGEPDEQPTEPTEQPTEQPTERKEDDIKYIIEHIEAINALSYTAVGELLIFTDPNAVAAAGINKSYIKKSDYQIALDIIEEDKRRREEEERRAKEEAEKAAAAAEAARREAEEKAKGLRPEAAEALAIATAAKNAGRGIAPYLWGPAGTGKSTMVEDIARKLELPLYTQSCVFNEFELFGFADANGNYTETAFFKAFTQGGIFLLDEMDCSDICSLKKLNGAIANRCYCFPVVGMQRMHKDCYIFATGNTMCKPDAEYSGAQLIDVSTVDRFVAIRVDYNEEIESNIAARANAPEVAEFVQDLRRAVAATRTNFVCSFRLTEKLITCKEAGLSPARALECCINSFIDDGTRDTLRANLTKKSNPYAKIF